MKELYTQLMELIEKVGAEDALMEIIHGASSEQAKDYIDTLTRAFEL